MLILINLAACSSINNQKSLEIKPQANPRISNNFSVYYFNMAEIALQEGNIPLALQLYEKADEQAPDNVFIKEMILEIMEVLMINNASYADKLIELGNEYVQRGIISHKILDSLMNVYQYKEDSSKFMEILSLQVEKYPSMRTYSLKYYYELKYHNKSDKELLEQALGFEWENVNEVISVAFEFADDKEKVLDIVGKIYQKWTEVNISQKELAELYDNLGVEQVFSNLILANLQAGQHLIDEIASYYLMNLQRNGKYEQILQSVPYFIDSSSTYNLELIFSAAVYLQDWETAINVGSKIVFRNDL
ncbi:MAG: hypothetical protein KAS49_07090, partial [Candidatus Cloacimonetes bacterium]|nr:hypothetical protein [Candidatus Cloacimonadota bacterium]